jgi:uncharacterized protein YjbJ (UPF0337 family)
MDKDRVKGSVQQVKGKLKETVGKAVGDTKLKSEGKADRAKGKIRNRIGGGKDAMTVEDELMFEASPLWTAYRVCSW